MDTNDDFFLLNISSQSSKCSLFLMIKITKFFELAEEKISKNESYLTYRLR